MNCVQVRAPDNILRCNKETYDPGEHIGHIKRDRAAKLAPVIDDLTRTGMLDYVCFDCFLSDGDTNHSRKGDILNVVIMCRNIKEVSYKLANLLSISQL